MLLHATLLFVSTQINNIVHIQGYTTTICVIAVLSVLYVNSTIEGRNFAGIVSGLLWWKFLLHGKSFVVMTDAHLNNIHKLIVTLIFPNIVKGMSENLSTLIYSIMQV